MERLESCLVRSLERDFSRSYNKPLQKLGVSPRPVPAHVKIYFGLYARNTFLFFAGMVLFAFLVLALYFVFLVLDTFTLHQIEKHWRGMLHVGFTATKGPLLILLSMPFITPLLFTAGLYPSIWAWNRRAERLSREGILPQPTLAADTGVWPPPPSVSASSNTPSKI